MDINSIGNYMSSYYASYVHKADVASANADFKTTSQKASKAEETEDVRELSDEEKLENFKKEVWKELDSLPWNNTLNFSIQITDSAFKRMMTDEDFKNRAMSKIKEDASVCRPPIVSCMITVDENGYRGVSYNDYNSGITTFKAHSKGNDSFYVKKADQKAVYKRQEEKRYLEKLQEEKRIEKERLDDWIAGLEANRRLKGDVENNSGTMSEMKMIQVTTAIKAYEDSASFL